MTPQRVTQTGAAESDISRAARQPAPSVRRPERSILRLQRTIGNRAVQRLIESRSASTETALGDGEELSTDVPVGDIVNSGLSSPGQPLDADTREFMEGEFGYDFSGVKVHTNGAAADSSSAIDAHAYTVGQDIVFGSGKYSPNSSEGKKLIAHELTHVVQQSTARVSESAPDGSVSISDPSDGFERSAEATASQVVSHAYGHGSIAGLGQSDKTAAQPGFTGIGGETKFPARLSVQKQESEDDDYQGPSIGPAPSDPEPQTDESSGDGGEGWGEGLLHGALDVGGHLLGEAAGGLAGLVAGIVLGGSDTGSRSPDEFPFYAHCLDAHGSGGDPWAGKERRTKEEAEDDAADHNQMWGKYGAHHAIVDSTTAALGGS